MSFELEEIPCQARNDRVWIAALAGMSASDIETRLVRSYRLERTKALAEAVQVSIIASGGVREIAGKKAGQIRN